MCVYKYRYKYVVVKFSLIDKYAPTHLYMIFYTKLFFSTVVKTIVGCQLL